METFWSNPSVDRQINIWWFSARVFPLVALFVLGVLHFLDLDSVLDYILIASGIFFITCSVTWWWWVMHLIKNLNRNIYVSVAQFEDITNEIKNLRKELKKINVSNR